MSKINPKSNNKAIKKTARKAIEESLTLELKAVAGKFGIASKKANKFINTSAGKLAKKLAKEIKIYKASAPETTQPVESAIVAPVAKPVTKTTRTKTIAKAKV